MLEGLDGAGRGPPGPHATGRPEHRRPWWQVMCLTGVDYFSTLGYQPGIAALAAGALVADRHPRAGRADPVRRAAGVPPGGRARARTARARSPCSSGCCPGGRASCSSWCCSGFAATDFIITITLSAADATAHVVENPFAPAWLARPRGRRSPWCCSPLLGAVFLKGFKEAIGIAVVLVGGLPGAQRGRRRRRRCARSRRTRHVVGDWTAALLTHEHGNPLADGRRSPCSCSPSWRSGLSGFETGVAVMPQVKGDADDTERPARGPHPRHAQAADHRRAHHERLPGHVAASSRRC